MKNTAKPVTEVSFPAVTICASGFHMNTVEEKIQLNFQKWRIENNRTSNDTTEIRKDTEEYMMTTFQIEPPKDDSEPANILDILDTMVASNPGSFSAKMDASSTSSSSADLPGIDIFLNPNRTKERDMIAARKQTIAKNYFTKATSAVYPNLFDILWDSTLPCFKNEDDTKDHLLLSCQLGGKNVPCSSLFTRVPTDTGMCCALNNVDALRDSEYKQLVRKQQGENMFRRPIDSTVGQQKGLRLTLDLHSNMVSFGSLGQEYDAFKIFIGQPQEFPMIKERSLKLQPGREHFIELSAKVVSTKDIRGIAPESRECHFHDEGDLAFYEKYTYSNCRLECAIMKSVDIYGCVPWYLPRVTTAKDYIFLGSILSNFNI